MATLTKSALAEIDLIDIWQYSNDAWGETQADQYLDVLDQSMRAIVDQPLVGTDVGWISPGYRRLQSGSHVIYYLVRSDDIYIVRVLHGRMDVADRF